MKRVSAVVVAAFLLAGMGLSVCHAASSTLALKTAFVQFGEGTSTQTVTFGIQWASAWHREWGSGELFSYVEASIGRWRTEDKGMRRTAWVTQLGLTPALRYQWDGGDSPWFAEAGIGINVLAPVFRDGDRQFSTAFNFGDHIALGRSFDSDRRKELSLRLQHFSNGGIKRPNPGINFIQLRYTHAF